MANSSSALGCYSVTSTHLLGKRKLSPLCDDTTDLTESCSPADNIPPLAALLDLRTSLTSELAFPYDLCCETHRELRHLHHELQRAERRLRTLKAAIAAARSAANPLCSARQERDLGKALTSQRGAKLDMKIVSRPAPSIRK